MEIYILPIILHCYHHLLAWISNPICNAKKDQLWLKICMDVIVFSTCLSVACQSPLWWVITYHHIKLSLLSVRLCHNSLISPILFSTFSLVMFLSITTSVFFCNITFQKLQLSELIHVWLPHKATLQINTFTRDFLTLKSIFDVKEFLFLRNAFLAIASIYYMYTFSMFVVTSYFAPKQTNIYYFYSLIS